MAFVVKFDRRGQTPAQDALVTDDRRQPLTLSQAHSYIDKLKRTELELFE